MASPRISLVTPTYNHAKYIEETILSVLEQKYDNLQYIIIDGGSTDGSVDIIRKYSRHLAYWESTPDRGQSHAINKALPRCDGEIVNWLCSDDQLMPGALRKVAESFTEHSAVDVVAGSTVYARPGAPANGRVAKCTLADVGALPAINRISQPSCFFRRRCIDRVQPIIEEFHCTMDWELWCYFLSKGAQWLCIDDVLSRCLITGTNKSMDRWRTLGEIERIYRRYAPDCAGMTYVLRYLWLPLARASRGEAVGAGGKLCWHASRAIDRILNEIYGVAAAQNLRETYWLYGGLG